MLAVSLPADYSFPFCHIGTLFCMDANKDGRFTLDDLISSSFAETASNQIKKSSHRQHEVTSQLQAQCTLTLWNTVCGDDAKEAEFVAWLSRLVYEDRTVKYFEPSDVPFIRSETIKALYELLQIRQTHNIEFQAFFALMQ